MRPRERLALQRLKRPQADQCLRGERVWVEIARERDAAAAAKREIDRVAAARVVAD